MVSEKKDIVIVGAGLVGSLLSIYLAQAGFEVSIYEKRSDYRHSRAKGGRSINLALSDRGWRALEEVGIADDIRQIAIPMRGRMIHDEQGHQSLQPYGKPHQAIYSVSRSELNLALTALADSYPHVTYIFNQECLDVDLRNSSLTFQDTQTENVTEVNANVIIGADGAFSEVRAAMQRTPRFNYSQHYIEHAYKELTIPPLDSNGGYALEKNALHIWPRKQFMLIALPNTDGSFTCTLFYDFEAFKQLDTRQKVQAFFQTYFADVVPIAPNYLDEFFENPTSSMVTISCDKWIYKNTVLIGDASHAIVPFYGQGMNAGFEDCRIFNQMLQAYQGDWNNILHNYQVARVQNAHAISTLAMRNFVEMRDRVTDEQFLLRKKIEKRLYEQFPEQWVPLYSMVTFSHMSYADALALAKKQDVVMSEILKREDIESTWQNLDLEKILNRLLAI